MRTRSIKRTCRCCRNWRFPGRNGRSELYHWDPSGAIEKVALPQEWNVGSIRNVKEDAGGLTILTDQGLATRSNSGWHLFSSPDDKQLFDFIETSTSQHRASGTNRNTRFATASKISIPTGPNLLPKPSHDIRESLRGNIASVCSADRRTANGPTPGSRFWSRSNPPGGRRFTHGSPSSRGSLSAASQGDQ